IIGDSGSGKHELAQVLARLVLPSAGRVSVDGSDLATLPTAVLGRRLAYVGATPYLFTQSLGDNLLASLRHVPMPEVERADPARARKHQFHLREARLSGNIDFDIEAEWIDYEAAGVADRAALIERVVAILALVELDQDVYLLGLRSQIDPARRPEAAE